MRRFTVLLLVFAAFGFPAHGEVLAAQDTDLATAADSQTCISTGADHATDHTTGLAPAGAVNKKHLKTANSSRPARTRIAPGLIAQPPGSRVALVLGIAY